MAKKMLIDATHPEETRVVVADGNRVEDFDFESASKRQIAGNIYLAKVTRVEPSLQAAFVEYGGNRHGFLAFAEIHPDYYQIPIADRQAILAEERAMAESQGAEEDAAAEARGAARGEGRGEAGAEDDEGDRRRGGRQRRGRGRGRELAREGDAVATREASSGPAGMETIDLGEGDEDGEPIGLDGAAAGPSGSPSPVIEAREARDEASASDEAGEAAAAGSGEGPIEVVDANDAIETVAEEDDHLEMRAPRRTTPRARRYKIQEVVKVRQIMLVQVVKEERGNKGAALTTYLSLAGRYCVLMPNTARGGGISRKITNAADRKKLKDIASDMDVPQGAGLIIRTAGSERTKGEIARDYEYLQRLWEQIRALTLKSIAPAKIYEEGDLIKRSIRDLYSGDIDEVVVAGDEGFLAAREFMKMIMPAHAKNVIHYHEPLPLFARYGLESYLASMFNPVVQLPSGGYIVIGVTEALVAIDVNSGRATKEGSIEQTALKTNLEASDEIARQLRLRDLAGLIVVDYIDMDERRNNATVEKRFKDKLKSDRARIQVGRISGFGLLEMSRQRLRPGMLETTTQPCPHCHGTGLLRSDDSVALAILRQIDEEGTRGRTREILARVPVSVANYLVNHKREHVLGIEQRYGMAVRIEADTKLISPDFALEKFRTATRQVPEPSAIVMAAQPSLMPDEDDYVEEVEDAVEEPEVEEASAVETEAVEAEAADEPEAEAPARAAEGEEDRPRRKRRRRRRRRAGEREEAGGEEAGSEPQGLEGDEEDLDDEGDDEEAPEALEVAPEPAPDEPELELVPEPEPLAALKPEIEPVAEPEPAAEEAPRRRTRVRSRAEPAPPEPVTAEAAVAEPVPAKPAPRRRARKAADPAVVPEGMSEAPEVVAAPPKRARRTRSSGAAPAVVPEAAPAAATLAEQVEASIALDDESALNIAPDTPRGEAPALPADAAQALAPAPESEPASEAPAEKPKRKGWWAVGRG